MSDWPLVDPFDDGIRPAGSSTACFYCGQRIGHPHLRDCVIVQKRVRLRYVFEVDVEVPHAWTPEQVEAHRNESSWCADNAIEELEAQEGCLCPGFTCEFVNVLDDTPRRKVVDRPQLEADAEMWKLFNPNQES